MSLAIPESYRAPYNIVSIDPGSNFLGIAVTTLDPVTNTILNITAFTIVVEYLIHTDYTRSIENIRPSKMSKIRHEMLKILDYYNPKVVVCESPFFNRLRPGAFAPLVETLYVLQSAVLEYDSTVPFMPVEPSVIKKAIGAGHICGKDEVKTVIGRNLEIQNALTTPYVTLDEHSIDAVAIGYTYLKWIIRKEELCSR